MEDPSNPMCAVKKEVSGSLDDLNDTRIKEEVQIKQEIEEIEGGSHYALNSLCEPDMLEHIEQEVDPLGNGHTLENTSSIAGEKIEGSVMNVPFPDYEGRSRTTCNYVKIYKEDTLRAMAAIANEQAALAAKFNNPVESVQAKKIIPLEFFDQKPKVSDQIKLNILEEAKANFQQIATSSKVEDAEQLISVVTSNEDHKEESNITKSRFKNYPNEEKTIVMRGFKSSDIIDRTRVGSDEEIVKEESLSEEFIDEDFSGNKIKFGINCKSQYIRNIESQEGTGNDRKLGQLGQVTEKLIENLKSEIEWAKPLIDTLNDKGKDGVGCGRSKKELISLCKTTLVKIGRIQKLVSKQLGIVHVVTASRLHHLPNSKLNFQGICYKNGNPIVDPLTCTNTDSKEDKSVKLKYRMTESSAIINELNSKGTRKELSGELSELLELLETIELFKKLVKKGLADLKNDLGDVRLRRKRARSVNHSERSKKQSCKNEQCTTNNIRKMAHEPEFKKGKKIKFVKGLSLDKVHVMPRQLLKIQNPTTTPYIPYGQKGTKKRLNLQEVEEKIKLEQELAKNQLAAMNLRTKNHPPFLPTTPKARLGLGVVKSLELFQKEKSTQQGRTAEISIKISTAGQKVTSTAQSKINPEPTETQKKKRKKFVKLSEEELIKAEEEQRLEQELAEAQLASLKDGTFTSQPPPFAPATPRARLHLGRIFGMPAPASGRRIIENDPEVEKLALEQLAQLTDCSSTSKRRARKSSLKGSPRMSTFIVSNKMSNPQSTSRSSHPHSNHS